MFKKKTESQAQPETTPATVATLKPRRTPAMPGPGGPAGRLTVGPDIRLKGAAIENCDTLHVEGRVEASMDSRVIQIEQSGVFVGAAAVDNAEIHGHFEGEMTARERLVIHKTGRVTGTIRYGRLSIEEGGQLAGDIGAAGETSPARHSEAVTDDISPASQPEAATDEETPAETASG